MVRLQCSTLMGCLPFLLLAGIQTQYAMQWFEDDFLPALQGKNAKLWCRTKKNKILMHITFNIERKKLCPG